MAGGGKEGLVEDMKNPRPREEQEKEKMKEINPLKKFKIICHEYIHRISNLLKSFYIQKYCNFCR
jgi:hypothetical protein